MFAYYRHSQTFVPSKGALKFARFALRVVLWTSFYIRLQAREYFCFAEPKPKAGVPTICITYEEMKRKSNKNRNTSLNFKNPKQRDVINLFAVSEGRVERKTIMNVGNKDILYRMINLGYIKETVKGSGVFKATPKLKSYTEQMTGVSYNNGCSNKHSAVMSKTAINVIPKSVLSSGRYTGQNQIKSRMEKFKHTPRYNQGLSLIRDKVHSNYRYCSDRYNSSVGYQEKIDARKDLEIASMKQSVIDSDNPFYTPDIEITITRDEAAELLDNIRAIADLSDGREYSFMVQNEEKLSSMLGGSDETFTLGVEIVTENYCNEELYRHEVYEVLTGESVLYFC